MEMLDALIHLSDLDWSWEVMGDTALNAAFADAFRIGWRGRPYTAAS
jgi:hypothetical protein